MIEKNFGLTEEEFVDLLQNLKEGKEALFEKVFLSQFEKSLNYVKFKYKTSREEAYDVCMDSIIYFRKLLLNDKIHYGNLRALFNQISSQNYLKYINKKNKIQSTNIIPELMENVNSEEEDKLKLLNYAWGKLGEDCKYILKNFYYNNRKLYEIAESLNKTPSAIRKQKERCINALRMNIRTKM